MIGKRMTAAITLAFLLVITGCSDKPVEADTSSGGENGGTAVLYVNDTPVSVLWEENKSVEELLSLLEEGEITVNTERYGGFEQVGSLPQSLVTDDVQMTTTTGDIVLYNGNSIVLFYGSNSWSYTKLGRIDGKSADEIKKLLDVEEAAITISTVE